MLGMIMFIIFVMSCLLVFIASVKFCFTLFEPKIEENVMWGIPMLYSTIVFAPCVTYIYIWAIREFGVWAYIMRPLGSF